MKTRINFGMVTASMVSIGMKETGMRMMREARRQRYTFVMEPKTGYDGKPGDMRSSADISAQKICVDLMRELFPNYGFIGEENELKIQGVNGFEHLVWVIDPVDGTKAYGRYQSDGIGTMMALLDTDKKEVLAAFVGNVLTGEMFYYRPESDNVHRLTIDDNHEYQLLSPKPKVISKSSVLLNKRERRYSKEIRRVIDGFYEVTNVSGSIGVSISRLWTGEVAAVILAAPSHNTPWDNTPFVGISEKLGFRFAQAEGKFLMPITASDLLVTEVTPMKHEVIIYHKENEAEIRHLFRGR
jgi:fructose-1,6-bisphosphatase/inositol monophosphatase family enzyme